MSKCVFSILLVAPCLFLANSAPATLIITHDGSVDPVAEGFSPDGFGDPSVTGPIADDRGLPAWSIAGTARVSQLGYFHDLSTGDEARLASNGFSLTVVARVVREQAPAYDSTDNVVIINTAVRTVGRRYEIALGLDANGDTVVALPSSIDNSGPGFSLRAPGQNVTLVGSGNGYHRYELIFDPMTELAHLLVDGVLRIQDYEGHTSFAGGEGVLVWGANSGGRGNFNFVELVIVPEPSTATLLLMGMVRLAAGRRRCREGCAKSAAKTKSPTTSREGNGHPRKLASPPFPDPHAMRVLAAGRPGGRDEEEAAHA